MESLTKLHAVMPFCLHASGLCDRTRYAPTHAQRELGVRQIIRVSYNRSYT